MNKTIIALFLLSVLLTMQACAPRAAAPAQPTPTPQITEVAATATPAPSATPPDATLLPTEPDPSTLWKPYANSDFGLRFQVPPGWFGPDVYAVENTLRLEVGSDVVYPYGTSPEERITTLKNAYYVTIQYARNDQNTYWRETLQSLAGLQDGEALSDARSLIIKVRDLRLGRYQGAEFISTLSETAQTEPVYARQVILVDEQSNLLTVMGSPANVETGGAGWREAYRQVDADNQEIFRQMVESIAVE